jgi:sigma-E factor negative regulatory protein RseC
MADRIGLVIGNENDGRARIIIDRKGACGGCHTTGSGCRSCLSSAKMESLVLNPVGARSGDIVQVSLKSGNLLIGAALLYVLPVLALLGGALIGSAESSVAGWDGTSATVLGGGAGLAIGFGLVMGLDRCTWVRRRLAPRITAVLVSESSSSAPAQNSCCG